MGPTLIKGVDFLNLHSIAPLEPEIMFSQSPFLNRYRELSFLDLVELL